MCRDKMRDIENILKTRIENDKANTFVVIVPTDSARLHRQRELVGYHPNRAVANLRVYTLGSFIQRLYDQVNPPRQHISQGLQNLWLHEIANPQLDNPNFHRYDTFRPSQNIPVPDSTLSLIADTINRLKEYGEDTLNIGDGESQNPTEDDLICIYYDYETKLKERWIDEQGKRLHLANANNFDSLMVGAFPRVDLVVVEGFTALSKADIKILTQIAKVPQIEMWFRTDCVEENENLYKNIIDLVSLFSAVNANIDPNYEREPERHQHYADNLFQTDDSCVTPIAAPHIKVLKPADRSEEVEEIARRIQKHVAKKHCNFNDICVACYNIGQYEKRIAEVFPTYGIPYSLLESTPLTKSEVVKAIFSRLSSRPEPLNGDYFSDVEPASHERVFHPREFQEYIDNLLKKGEVVQHILNPMFGKNQEIVEAEIEAYRQFDRIVKELCSVLMSEGVETDFLGNYIKKLHYIAKHTVYRNKMPTKGEAVKIVRLSELRSKEFDTVFLSDFVEGGFPENYRPDPLLPNHPYRTEEEHLYNNRLMFYGVLKSFRERLYLLVPQRERESELIPSPFLGQLKAIADVETIEVANPERGSVPSFLSTYGNHVWTTPTPSNQEFPDNLANMRSLIDHVIAVEKSREETHEHLAYEGVLTSETLSTENREYLKSLRQRTYSVTELETYAKCPFQYFASKILGLGSPDEEDTEGLSSREKGELVHDVLVRFYGDRREQPAINRCDEASFEAAKQQLSNIIDEMISDTDSEDLFRRVDKTHLKVTLNQWLTVEREHDVTTIPRYFEVSVGRRKGIIDSVLSRPDPICISNVSLNAKIDRIDIGNGVFNIIDYKTGRTFGVKDILEGRALQLPIYLAIAGRLLGNGYETAAGLYHKVRLNNCKIELGIGKESCRGETYTLTRKTQQMLPDETFDDTLARVSGYLAQYVTGISNGKFPIITRVKTFSGSEDESEKNGFVETDEYGFVDSEEHGDKPLTPRNRTAPCSYCAYKRVCRVGAFAEEFQSGE